MGDIRYEQYRWGDGITGTKEQLQAIGLGVGMSFPGEPGGPPQAMTVVDPRGFKAKIRREFRGSDLFYASVPLPGRERPDKPAVAFCPGVTLRQRRWCDEYEGSAPALAAAGLCRLDQLPGQPGMRKRVVTVFPDGTLPTGAATANTNQFRGPGAKQITRASANAFRVRVEIDDETSATRRDAFLQMEREWEARMDAMPRPAPLMKLPRKTDITQLLRGIGLALVEASNPSVPPPKARHHLRLVWSAPAGLS